MKSHSKRVKIWLLLETSENISFLEKKLQFLFFLSEIVLQKKKRFFSKKIFTVAKNGRIFTLESEFSLQEI